MPFKHGAVNGVLEEVVVGSVVVVRSCSWSCHHCVLERFEHEFQASLRRQNVPGNDGSVWHSLASPSSFLPGIPGTG
eukprot:1312067-Alexandrium_andersonii.AAC.1